MDKCSSTSIASIEEKSINVSSECSSKVAPPSNKKRPKGLAPRRKQGESRGYIECKPIKRSGKEYKQYWYHYEEWREGDRVTKKSRYIPMRLMPKVEKLEAEKVSVEEILMVLRNRKK